MIVNYDHTVIAILNYNRKTFIEQATDFVLLAENCALLERKMFR